MDEPLQGYSDLIGAVYEAALDTMNWDEALTRFVSLFGPPQWDVAFLCWERASVSGARFVGATGLASHAREAYSAHFAGRNPWSARLVTLPAGRVVDTDEVVGREALLASDLYRKFLSNWQIERAVAVVVDRHEEERLALVAPGPDVPDIDRMRRGFRLLAPHLQRAVRISRRIVEADLRLTAANAALAQSPSGIVALTADLRVINANPRALALADAGMARIVDGVWRFADRAAQAALTRLSQSAPPHCEAFTAEDGEGRELAVLGLRVATPVAATLDGFLEGAGILLTLGVKAKAPAIPMDHLAAWYDLTPAEARLAAALSAGETLAEFANRRGVSDNAVRFLLKGVFRKTEAPDQARLVAMLRALPPAP